MPPQAAAEVNVAVIGDLPRVNLKIQKKRKKIENLNIFENHYENLKKKLET